MIIDCFTFYNELKMLNFRLHELNDHIDYFIICEATQTHQGNPKPLFFERNKLFFKKFLNKIIHVVIDDFPETEDPWVREKYQRNAIHRGLSQLDLNLEDLIIISDVDEIPDINSIIYLKNNNFDGLLALKQDFYYYNLTCKTSQEWLHAKVCSYKKYLEIGSPEQTRWTGCNVLNNGGWHLSYFGDVNFIKNKIKNFAHSEVNQECFLKDEHIEQSINNNKDIFNRIEDNIIFTSVSIKENPYLPKNYTMLL